MSNKQYLDQEGLQLKICSPNGDSLQLIWNHDNVENAIKHGNGDEFYVTAKDNSRFCGVDFSLADAIALRDTLDHMIKKLSK
ncbi:hypothetical protein [Paenibacillus xylanexedens]|uniref:hypothetical protein n=1 Tax=Paenibacillus xylanexedens TaxID=528191 RepID=UPI0011AAA390|nr:hypothetical protein [Paenibacillus xylanexedens]